MKAITPRERPQDRSHPPNQKWVGDITYLATGEGWLYLAVLIDLYSRKVIGWAMSERMTADLVVMPCRWPCEAERCPRA